MTGLSMDALFEGRRVPRWLRAFERDPDAALGDLLRGRADLGHLGAAEPSDLLLDWLHALDGDFAAACDVALAHWIARSWRDPVSASGSATGAATAWVTVCDVIAGATSLAGAAAALRERFLGERHVLAALVEGRARDPEGRAWLALARHQPDRSLLSEWWRLCRLPPDEPWYRGFYGIQGLQGLPPEAPDRGGGFRLEVAEGLRVLALALLERQEDGWLRPGDAQREFVPLARLTVAAYPFPSKWRSFWEDVLRRDRQNAATLEQWVAELDLLPARRPGRQRSGQQPPRRGGVRLEPDPRWVGRAKTLRQQLEAADSATGQDTVAAASKLLSEQAAYARATGDTYYVVRSACSFAAAVRHTNAALALEWSAVARDFEPWNAYAWTTSAECALAIDQVDDALGYALEATRRFPNDVVARNGLAEVLKAKGDLEQAEAVYREASERFPNNVVARTGLAEILRARGKLDEAAAHYQEALDGWPHDMKNVEIARHGLEAIRRVAEHGEEPPMEATARPAPRAGGPSRSTTVTTGPSPGGPATLRAEDVPHLLADAYLLRRWGLVADAAAGTATPTTGALRQRARGLLAALQPQLESDARVAAGSGLLELTLGELHEAAALLREAAQRFPGSARVRYALARVERALAQGAEREPDAARGVTDPWRRLGRLDSRFRPVALLGEGRAWLAFRDGQVAEERARESFGQLAYWLSQHRARSDDAGSAGFVAWWSTQVDQQVFADRSVKSSDDLREVAGLRRQVERAAVALDRLEEEFVERFAAV